jgi:hypothetical protein
MSASSIQVAAFGLDKALTATFTEPIRVAVGQGLCHRCQCQLIKRLHGSVVKRRNRKRPVLAVLLRDVNPSQRFGLRATLAQALRRPPCGSGALPQDTVNAGSLAPVVRGHAFDRQELGVERAGEPVWPGANLVPPTRLDRLCDTYLYPSDFPAGQGPVDPVPWRRIIVGCTSRSRLCLPILEGSPHSLATEHLSDVGTRGSIPTPGSTTLRYGGNTSCVEVQASDGTLVILDCGTGARG